MTDDFAPTCAHSLTLGRWRTRALVAGQTENPTLRVLCLHGWGDSAESYLRLFSRLDGIGELIALDFPGSGYAQPVDDGPQLPQYVDFAREALRHYGAQGPLLLVGQSLGARALMMALHDGATDAAQALVAIGPAPLKLPGWQQILVRNGSLMPNVSSIAAAHDDATLIAELVASHRRTCFHDPARVPDQAFADYARFVTVDRAKHHIERLRRFGAEIGQPLQLSQVPCPVTLVWGDKDRISPLSAAQDYLAALPAATLTTSAGCGHHAHLEDPDAVAAAVRVVLDAPLG